MSNVEHPKHYQVNIELEVLNVIDIVIKNLKGLDAFCMGNVIKYLFRAEKKNGIEDYKKALYYLRFLEDNCKVNFYSFSEKEILKKFIYTIQDEKIQKIIRRVFFNPNYSTYIVEDLEKYIEERESKGI